MVDPIMLGTIRAGFLLGQVGISAVREIIAWANQNNIDLPALETILADIEKDQKAAEAATDAILNH